MITVRNTSDGQISERIKLTFNLSNRQPLLGKLNSSIRGTETEDATATAKDIRKGEIAYVKDEQIIGELEEYNKLFFEAQDMEYMVGGIYGPVGQATFNEEDIILSKGAKIDMLMPLEKTKELLGITSDKILPGNTILGVDGTATSDATASNEQVLAGQTAYVNGEKIEGIMPNNGALNFAPSDEQQVIPSGYTEGGYIQPANIETLKDYNTYLSIADEILGEEV